MTDNFETIRNEDENYDIFFGFENEEDHDQENEKVLKEEFIMFEKKKSKIESTIKKFKSLKPDKW